MGYRPLITSALTILLVGTFLGGCSSFEQDFCERLIEECNSSYFNVRNVDDCTEQVEKDLDNLVSSKRADCESALEACVEKENCGNFIECTGVAILTDCI